MRFRFRHLLGTKASLEIDPAGGDNAVTYTARRPGTSGNKIQIAYNAAGSGTDGAFSISGKVITVTILDGTTSADDVVSEFANAPQAVKNLLGTPTASEGDGTGAIPFSSLGAANLTGGENLGPRRRYSERTKR